MVFIYQFNHNTHTLTHKKMAVRFVGEIKMDESDLKHIAEYKEAASGDIKEYLINKLKNAMDLKDLLVAPNILETMAADGDVVVAGGGVRMDKQIMKVVNTDGLSPSKSTIGFTLVEPGRIGVFNHNGRIQVVGAGRWKNLNPRCSWVGSYALNGDPIQVETLTIVRVPKGSYGLASQGGQPLILDEGLHVRNDRNFKFEKLTDVNMTHIRNGTINIIRVPVGHYGQVVEDNIPRLLLPGSYVVNNPYFVFDGIVISNAPHIVHKNINVVRVPKGQLYEVVIDNRPHLLSEGVYVYTVPFKMNGFHDVNMELITHSTISRFFIRHGKIGLAWYKSRPIFITVPRLYMFDDADFIYHSMVDATQKQITLGSRNRILVSPGEIGLALHNNESIFLDTPGVYEYNDPNFKFAEFAKLTDKRITLGSKTRVIVSDGEVGVSQTRGRFTILPPDIYMFDMNESKSFYGFISTRQQSIQLDDVKSGVLKCETKDFVEVGIRAAVYYCISNPEKALKTIGDAASIAHIVKENSIASLQSIIRSIALSQVAQSKLVNVKAKALPTYPINNPQEDDSFTPRWSGRDLPEDMKKSPLVGLALSDVVIPLSDVSANPFESTKSSKAPLEEKTSKPFFENLHDQFIAILHDDFTERFGIDISNIRIEEFKMMNAELAKNISNQAISTAQTQTQLANLEGQTEIATAQQARDASVARIKSEADARNLDIATKAKMSATIAENETKVRTIEMLATAEAKALKVKIDAETEAKANTILKVAEAEAKAIEVKAEAERKRALALEATEIGQRIALYEIKARAAVESMRGVQTALTVPSRLSHDGYCQ